MFKGSYLFQTIILGIHVSFRGCNKRGAKHMLVELERHPKDAQGWSPYATSEYPLPPIIMFFRGKWVYLQYIYIHIYIAIFHFHDYGRKSWV